MSWHILVYNFFLSWRYILPSTLSFFFLWRWLLKTWVYFSVRSFYFKETDKQKVKQNKSFCSAVFICSMFRTLYRLWVWLRLRLVRVFNPGLLVRLLRCLNWFRKEAVILLLSYNHSVHAGMDVPSRSTYAFFLLVNYILKINGIVEVHLPTAGNSIALAF